MGRRLLRTFAATTDGANTTLLTVPGGKKFEVVDLTCQSDLVHTFTYYFAVVTATFPFIIDTIVVVPPSLGEAHQYAGIVLLEGEQLVVFSTNAGHGNGVAYAGYVEVDL